MVADARARLSLDAKPFTDTLKDAGQSVEKDFGKQLEGVGRQIKQAFTVGALVAFGNKILSTADEVSNLSDRLGISAETTQSLGVVAKDSGLSMEAFETAILKTSKASIEAQAGSKQLVESFSKLGISVSDLRGMNPEELFEAVARSMANNKGNAEVLNAAFEILGTKSGPRLTSAMISLGEHGFDAINKKMTDSGQIMSNEVITKFDELEQKLANSGRQLTTWGGIIGLELVNAVEKFGTRLGALFSGQSLADLQKYETKQIEMMGVFKRNAEYVAEIAKEQEARRQIEIQQQTEINALVDKLAKISGAKLGNEEKLSELKIRQAELEAIIAANAGDTHDETVATLQAKIELEGVNAAIVKSEATIAKELEAQRKTSEAIYKEVEAKLQRSLSIRDAYNRAVYTTLSNEDKIKWLMFDQSELQEEINRLESEGLGQSDEALQAKTELIGIERDLKSLTEQNAETAGKAKDLSVEQVEKMKELRDVFKDMTEVETKKFLADMQNLANELRKIGGVDLGWITDLSKFKFTGVTSGQARQMVRAIKEMIEGLKDVAVPQGMKDLFELFGKLQGGPGTYKLDITVPKGWENGMILEPSFNATLKSIDTNLKTLAALKGVVWA